MFYYSNKTIEKCADNFSELLTAEVDLQSFKHASNTLEGNDQVIFL